MTSNYRRFLLCPIPEDQKPINEYIEITESYFTNWTSLSNDKYKSKLIFFLSCFFFFFSLFTINFSLFFLSSLKLTILLTLGFFLFFLFSIFIRWLSVNDRFILARLPYEEGTWYDGQLWDKPFSVIKTDKLISKQIIEPIIQRILQSISFLFLLSIFVFFFFLI